MANLQGHYEDANGNILLPVPSGAVSNFETGSRASQAYSKGSYLYFGNKLCKTITAIAQNDTLTIGTNLTQVSIGGEISAHLRASNGTEFSFQNFLDGVYG